MTPISKQMRTLTAVRFGLVVALFCVVLVGCGSDAVNAQEYPPPELSATRAGKVVTVSYRWSEDTPTRPKWIIVKVSDSARRSIPVGGTYPVHGSSGQVQVKVSFDEGDQLVALARTIDLRGHSEEAEAPVRWSG